MNTWDKCKNCGGERGLHHFETDQCPVGGREAPIGRKQEWKSTTFEIESVEPKQFISFERDGIDINGLTVGVHDMLMMALAMLKKKERTREIAITITDLEKVIAYHQSVVGVEDGARMKPLAKESAG